MTPKHVANTYIAKFSVKQHAIDEDGWMLLD